MNKFNETHPKVMEKMISEFNWNDKLQYSGKPNKFREPHKHEKFNIKLLSFIESKFLGGKPIGEFKNYNLINI